MKKKFELSTDNAYAIGRILNDAKHNTDIEVIRLPEANGGLIKAMVTYEYACSLKEQ